MRIFEKSIEIARALFDKEKHNPRCFVVSFGWQKNRLVGIGINSIKSNPANLLNPLIDKRNGLTITKPSTCAELGLFKKIKNITNIPFNKITIVNIRIDRENKLKMARPCSSCRNLLLVFGPKSLYYTNDDGNFERYI